jgi:hypothetical protein
MFDNSYGLACPSPTNNAGATGHFGSCTPPPPVRMLPPPTTTPTSSTTTTTLAVVCGDVNGDGAVNIGDALRVAQVDVGLRQCSQLEHPEVCDVNRDGACNVGDALGLAQCDVGLISCTFPCTPFLCQ